MNKKELRDAVANFKEYSAFVRKATVESIVGETEGQKQKRIELLLKPENYGLFFNHYLGKDTPIPMADSDCAWYHLKWYEELYRKPFLTQFRIVFRGGAKSVHSNVGNVLSLKQSGLIKFFLVIGINELRAKLLLAACETADLPLASLLAASVSDCFLISAASCLAALTISSACVLAAWIMVFFSSSAFLMPS